MSVAVPMQSRRTPCSATQPTALAPSLRAPAKQSMAQPGSESGLLRRARMTSGHDFTISPHVFARVLLLVPPSQSEGAGNAERPMRPQAACAVVVVERTRVSQVAPESPGIPRAMVYGLFRALPGDRLSCHRRPRKLPFTNLMPASGHQDHTSSPSASHAARLSAHPRPPHPAPRP